jgi:Cu(I)/Ag(I) efflux system membrane fusion protein
MRPGMTVAVKQGQMGKPFSAKVGKVLPLFDSTSRTLKVRIDVDNPRYDLRPDMFVDVEIPITMPASLSVPAGAVLDLGTRALVYVD